MVSASANGVGHRKESDTPSKSKPSEWTSNDETRLRGLSLDPLRSDLSAYPSTPNGHVSGINESDVGTHFRLVPAQALRFNPSVGETHDASQLDRRSTLPRKVSESQFHSRLTSVLKEKADKPHHSKPNVEVRIPLRSTPAPSQPDLTTKQYASERTPIRPSQPVKFSVNVPLSDSAKFRQARIALQEKLKEGPKYLVENPEEARRLLGMTGFSTTEFPLNLDEAKFRNAAQPKRRVVNRANIPLEVDASPPPLPTLYLSQSSTFVHPQDQAKSILTDRFSEDFDPPLTFSNSVNDKRLNGKFQFISEYILRKNVRVTGPIGYARCNCIAGCDHSCLCLRKTFKKEKSKHERFEQVPQYERRPDGLVVLRDDFIKRYTIQWDNSHEGDNGQQHLPERVEISECNDNCSCNDSCVNRVVQKGRTVPLEIFETNRCGFGVRSTKNLVRGQFIELYLGEVITEAELNRREAAAEAGSTSYIYSLDWFSSQQVYHIDGQNFGSAMRFVNHSCNPNAGTFTVLNHKSTKQLHHVAFFAIKDIPAGTEITIDYTPQAAGQTYQLQDADEGMERCYCGALNCRKMLWLPGKERKARKKTVGKDFD